MPLNGWWRGELRQPARGSPRGSWQAVRGLDDAVTELLPVLRSLAGDGIGLVTNACDALPEGGHVEVVASRVVEPAARCSCGVELAEGVPHARVEVIDDGPGLPPGLTTRVFDPSYLRRDGHRVTTAASGAEALRLLAGGLQIGSLITDVVMPEMSGFVLAAEARRKQGDLRVLFVSGYSGSASLAPARTRGEEVDLLARPFGMQELSDRVQIALVR